MTMQVDVEIDYSNNKISKIVGSPKFYMSEYSKIEKIAGGRFSATYGKNSDFGKDNWVEIVNANDLSLSGIKIQENSPPLDNWQGYVDLVRAPRAGVR